MKESRPIRLLAFDYDGTISNSLELILESFRAVFNDIDLDVPSEEALKAVIGLKLERCFEILAPEHDTNALSAAYRGRQHQLRREGMTEHLYPRAQETLKSLNDQGFVQSICTGKNLNGLETGLAFHGLQDLFFSLHTPDHAASKPSPEPLIQAMNRAGVEPENTLVIGDSTYDMLMAKNANVRAIGVDWGFGRVEDLLDAGASAIASDWRDLPALFEEMLP